MKIPTSLQPILWLVDVSKLDHQKDRHYIIHQVLVYGRMEELDWLFKNYTKDEIVNTFLDPYKNYPKFIFYFVKNYLLGCQDKQLNEDAYVTSIYGQVRRRTSSSFSETKNIF